MRNIQFKPVHENLIRFSLRIEADKGFVCQNYCLPKDSIDTRITFYSKLQNVFTPTDYSIAFIANCLCSENWWNDHLDTEKTLRERQFQIDIYENFTKISFVQTVFMAIESTLRIILREIDPVACNNGTGEFKNIYECLLSSKLELKYSSLIKSLDFLRLIRNSVHNNGVYFHHSNQSNEIDWNGNKYVFDYGKKITFVTWDLLFQIIDKILNDLKRVFSDKTLLNFKNVIADPFA